MCYRIYVFFLTIDKDYDHLNGAIRFTIPTASH